MSRPTVSGSDTSSSTAEARWDRIARESRWGRYITVIEGAMLQRGMAIATGPRVALEVGCESGRWAEILANDAWSVTCTEVDRRVLDLCQLRVPSAHCLHVDPDCAEIPAASASLGLLLCYEVFDVVHEPWFVDEAARVLAPGGVLIAVTHNRMSYRRLLWSANQRRSRTGDRPMYTRSYRSWRNQLLAHDFTPRYEEGLCWMPFSRMSDSPLVTSFNRLEAMLRLRRVPTLSPWICAVMQKDHAPTREASSRGDVAVSVESEPEVDDRIGNVV